MNSGGVANAVSTLGSVYWPAYAVLALIAVTTGAFLLCQAAPDPYLRLPSALVLLLVVVRASRQRQPRPPWQPHPAQHWKSLSRRMFPLVPRPVPRNP